MVNTLAFSGSKYLFSMLTSSDLNEERKRYDQAVEQLQATQAKRSRKRTTRLDWISEALRCQGHAVLQTFQDVDDAMREYSRVTATKLDPLAPEPKLSDFNVLSSGQRDREMAFVVLGIAATGLLAYKRLKKLQQEASIAYFFCPFIAKQHNWTDSWVRGFRMLEAVGMPR